MFRYPKQITLELSSNVLMEINTENWTQFHTHKGKGHNLNPDETDREFIFHMLVNTLVKAKDRNTWFEYGRMRITVHLDDECPASVKIGEDSASLYCANRSGEVEFTELTESELQFLDSLELLLDTVATM